MQKELHMIEVHIFFFTWQMLPSSDTQVFMIVSPALPALLLPLLKHKICIYLQLNEYKEHYWNNT